MPEIWTVGHSNKPIHEFLELLKAYRIERIADVRRFPVSRRHPHFEMNSLSASLNTSGMAYRHFPDLGGRRTARPDSRNTNWKNEAFRGYADYMETPDFASAIGLLEEMATKARTAIMCAEALWWQCHRALVSDYFKNAGWTVTHILSSEKGQEHPYTSAARMIDGRLSYEPESLFS